MEKKKKEKILLVGGGSGGPTVPLLVVAEEIKKKLPNIDFLFVGTKSGPERDLSKTAGIHFFSLPTAKLRRYWSWRNLFDPLVFLVALFRSTYILLLFKPKIIFSAGGFTSVPIIWTAWGLRKKIIIHQQDILPGLANRLSAPFATQITTAFSKTVKRYPPHKTIWVGNPLSRSPFSWNFRKIYKLDSTKPLMLVTGGGQGAMIINETLEKALPQLLKKYCIVHVTGRKKKNQNIIKPGYVGIEFLDSDKFDTVLQTADLVVCRSGLNTLYSAVWYQKKVITVPIPDSHQEQNAVFFSNYGVQVIEQKNFSPTLLGQLALDFNLKQANNSELKGDATQRLADIVLDLLH